MQTRVRKWGNSLALRIPKSFAAEAQVHEGSTVDISVERGDLVVRPKVRLKYGLNELLGRVNQRNLHRETSTGRRVGRESWSFSRQVSR